MPVPVDHALAAHAAGLCVLPPREDGSKAPIGEWKQYEERRPTEDEIRRWYSGTRHGLGFVCGRISGGLELFEFEGRAVEDGLHAQFSEACEAAGLGELLARIGQGYLETTPSGGVHFLYRCAHTQTEKLARRPGPDTGGRPTIEVLIETKGEGGYVIVAPTGGPVHPNGLDWELVAGGYDRIVTITPEERAALHSVARSFDDMPRPVAVEHAPRHTDTSDDDKPGDDFNRRARWTSILEPHGWRRVFQRGRCTHWCRPGKEAGTSATTGHGEGDYLYVFSSSTPFDPEHGYSKFAAYAILNHGGDYSAAARALAAEGYGEQRQDKPREPLSQTKQRELHDPARMTVAEANEILTPQIVRPFNRIAVDLTATIPATPMLPPWLYGNGCLTILQSEPGVGKSWIALWLSVHVMQAGYDVVYIDEEGGLELVHERLRLIGADPELVAERFWYYAFETRTWDEADMHATVAMLAGVPNPGLAVLDSLPDFLAVAGQDEDRAKDVTAFIKKVCGAFREVGCSQLLLDHLPKPAAGSKKERSRYSRGSGSKLGKADATLLLETDQEFDTHTSGSLNLWKTKDRRGRLPLPSLGRPGYHLDVTVSDGAVDITYTEQADAVPPWDGPTECMKVVLEVLQAAPGTEFSKSQIVTSVRALDHKFRDATVHEAAARLALNHAISYRKGARNADLYSFQPAGQVAAETLEEPF